MQSPGRSSWHITLIWTHYRLTSEPSAGRAKRPQSQSCQLTEDLLLPLNPHISTDSLKVRGQQGDAPSRCHVLIPGCRLGAMLGNLAKRKESCRWDQEVPISWP